MVKIIYVEHDGTEHSVDEVGTSIMEGSLCFELNTRY